MLLMWRQVRVAMEKGCSNVPGLAFQAGLSMEWLTELCCTPLFYYRCDFPMLPIKAPREMPRMLQMNALRASFTKYPTWNTSIISIQ